ncbi:HYR domain-containing protein [Archangium lansingense]|uniref:HYR domain-containing protein n=1 Tax=Archangium lansingense TaxID=2995310 RepID=UPI003B7E0B46
MALREVEATSESTPVTFAEASASDGVMEPPTVTYSHASGSTFLVGETVVTVTATDAAGNTASCSFRVTVNRSSGGSEGPSGSDGEGEEEVGSGCAAAGGSPAGLLGLLLLLAWPSLGRARARRS